MKGTGTLLITLILSGFFGPAASARTWLSNGSASNVQALHNSARDGDTITLPAGTFFWATTVTITKGITVIGQTTTDPVHKTANDQTIIMANTGANGNQPLLVVDSAPGKSYRVSGIAFRTGRTGVINFNGMVQLNGNSHAVRLDHCHFDDLVYENNNIAVWGSIYGVIDHNLFDFRSANNRAQSLYINMSDWGGRSYGDGSWAEPAYYGSEKFVFIEDNCINNMTSNQYGGVIDAWRGGRYVFRHNHVYNATPTNHGTEISRERGFRCAEIYNNDFHFTFNPSSLGSTRSGGWISHDNRIDGTRPDRGATLGTYRVFFAFIGAPFTGASGDNPWDYNVTEPNGTHIDGHPPYLFQSGAAASSSDRTHIVDLTKNWRANRWIGYTAKRLSDGKIALVLSNTSNTLNVYYHDGYGGGAIWQAGDQYQLHKVLVALDQPGRGAGDLINGSPAWPHQRLEPCYEWNDVYTPTGARLNMTQAVGAFAVLQEGRDFYNNTPMPGYTPYTYPHPLTTSLNRATLGNISTRSFVRTGDNVMIGGFIIQGTEPKTVIMRGIGPSLTPFGISNALADPTLELHDGTGALIASNYNWQTTHIGGIITANQVSAIRNSGYAPSQASESAIIATLPPGNYTAIVSGANNTTGVALVDVYDLSPGASSILGNISTRGFVQTGDNVMIGGFIIQGTEPKRVIMRAIGPSLAPFGIPNALADPTLELHDGTGALIASNYNWQTTHIGGIITANQVSAIRNSGYAPSQASESAIIATLPPGNYTAIVSGVNNTTGVALVDVSDLQ